MPAASQAISRLLRLAANPSPEQMAAGEQKSKAPKTLGRLHKGGYVASNPTPLSIQRNARDHLEAEDIMSEIERSAAQADEAQSGDSGLQKLLVMLERPHDS